MAHAKSNYLNSLEDDTEIISRIEAGESQAEIARSIGEQPSELSRWLNSDSQRSLRAREARSKSAEGWIDKATQVLEEIPDNGTQAQISRAKELAHHYRKIAAIRNPREYGDRIDISGKIDHEHSVKALFDAIVPQPSLLCQDAVLIEDNSQPLD